MTIQLVILFTALTLVGFALSALFSGLEIGLYSLNRVRLRLRDARGDAAARRLRRELAHPARVLVVLLIGTNAANYLGSYGLAELLHRAGLGDAALIALQATLFAWLLFVFAESLPKELFRRYTDRWTYVLSPMIVAARWVFTAVLMLPTVLLFAGALQRLLRLPDDAGLTERRRVAQMLKEGLRSGVLSVSQTTLADRALAMNDQPVRSAMVPWPRVVSIPLDASRDARERLLRAHSFTRMPVVDRTGRAVGVLAWSDAVLHRDDETSALMKPTVTLTPDQRVLDAMTTMRRSRQAMGIVVDDAERPLGIATLKNLVEPLTGELAAW